MINHRSLMPEVFTCGTSAPAERLISDKNEHYTYRGALQKLSAERLVQRHATAWRPLEKDPVLGHCRV